ncbi:hypothetical protein LL14B4_06270 [Lactococcus lactis subsp. lactis]|uniref:Uncharacterized protein n=1 Tax=Lactococcus lactis subsp. lactis TaxID=1360 RepID=A0A2Z3KDM5_LACLL|nr:hypothetical protein [Lactococcus lactis]AWN65802.1 hypothetical protein LL14B4_06270 [Lactococcus lactis subsp. lactis]
MGCTTCGQGNSQGSSSNSGCCDLRAMDVVTPLNDIRNGDENFCFSEITDKICENLKNDEGINPSATHSNSDCDDLSSLNDLATGSLHNALMTLNLCDVDAYKCWLDSLLSWQWNVDKALICAICGLWDVVHCLDGKTRNSVRVVNLWEGSKNVFDTPTMPVSQSLNDFDYLDLHFRFGTERVVGRVSLEGGISNFATITMMDKVAGNSGYGIDAGAIVAKEVGVQYPNDKNVKLDHFIWSLTGMSGGSLDTVSPAVFLALSSTAKTKNYSDTQDVAADRPHTIDKIEGIISRDTGSCIGG